MDNDNDHAIGQIIKKHVYVYFHRDESLVLDSWRGRGQRGIRNGNEIERVREGEERGGRDR